MSEEDRSTGQLLEEMEALRSQISSLESEVSRCKDTEKTLKESEKRFRALFESAADAIFILEAEGENAGEIIAANHAAAVMHGYKVSELMGMNIKDLDSPADAREAPKRIKKILKGSWLREEITHVRKDGTALPVEIHAGPMELGGHRYILAFDRDITERKRMEEELRSRAITDDLTGLFNRRGFFSLAPKQLSLCCRYNRDAVLLYSDLDGLKEINDKLGHVEGDRALADTADIFRMTFRESDVIARTGGDEFAVLMPETSIKGSDKVVERLRRNVASNRKRKRPYELSISIGAAPYDPNDPCSIDTLISRADRSMYEDKNSRNKNRR